MRVATKMGAWRLPPLWDDFFRGGEEHVDNRPDYTKGAGAPLLVHNWEFERYFSLTGGISEEREREIFDTQVWSQMHRGPTSLEDCAQFWCNDKTLVKDPAGEALVKRLNTLCRSKKKVEGKTHKVGDYTVTMRRHSNGVLYPVGAEAWDAVAAYCMQDIRLTYKLFKHLPTECMDFHKEGELLTRRINMNGMRIDTERLGQLEEAIQSIKDARVSLCNEFLGCDPTPAKIKKALLERGVSVPNTEKATLIDTAEKLKEGPIKSFLERYNSLTGSALLKVESLAGRLVLGDRLLGYLDYSGARATGRWSGKGFQTQNLPRAYSGEESWSKWIAKPEMYMNQLTGAIRSLVVPDTSDDNESLLIIDLTAIERNVAWWLADKEIPPGDMYQQFGDRFDTGLNEKERRDMGKEAILSLQFGLSWRMFQERMAEKKIVLDKATAKSIVSDYRLDTAPEIVGLWQAHESRMLHALSEGRDLMTPLRSGRDMFYRDLKQVAIHDPRRHRVNLRVAALYALDLHKKFTHQPIYGSKLFQHEVQATARDVFLEIVLEFNKGLAPYQIINLVHDEVVVSVGEKAKERVLESFEKACEKIRQDPRYKGLKIDYEHVFSSRYMK